MDRKMAYETQGDLGTAHETELSEALERLKREHDDLLRALNGLYAKARLAERETDPKRALPLLLQLRLGVTAFLEELERHSEWEEHELYPFLNDYFHRKHAPSIVPSLWMLEKDHELATDNLNSYLKAVRVIESNPDAMLPSQAAGYLIHACRILQEHLRQEEQLVFPMTEQVLTDMDYLFS
ncbi:hemerythrin domain-containing protein [Paenibacillus doosanensis]|uniref:hemerythrin domain-containing protein n=1 Tax=Paenibacillus doosanensis TaxID=1229154 RepID=UPI00217F9E66|nr:hemerythrin domain-containing protein [Paenibacillus doosanensis]MCS7460946.1 hemerythrin domain-containing protein [Paenibacillus doosanensis]